MNAGGSWSPEARMASAKREPVEHRKVQIHDGQMEWLRAQSGKRLASVARERKPVSSAEKLLQDIQNLLVVVGDEHRRRGERSAGEDARERAGLQRRRRFGLVQIVHQTHQLVRLPLDRQDRSPLIFAERAL